MNDLYRDYYKEDHKIAKVIVYIIIITLYNISFFVSFPYGLILNNLAISIWLFGINPTAYIVESIRKHVHKHDIL